MHLALLIDSQRLRREHDMFNRLTLALLDEGAQVTRMIPADLELDDAERLEAPVAHVSRIRVPMNVPFIMRGPRARAMARALSRVVPDVLIAAGQSAWRLALELGPRLERPVALEVWSSAQAASVPRGRSARHVAAYLAWTAPIAEALRQRVDSELVSIIPPSVDLPAAPRRILDSPERSITATIIGSGRDMSAYAALLAALSAVARETPQLQAAIELRGPHSHDIWREARRLGLLGQLSAVNHAAPVRHLLTSCDVLLMPERYGEVTTLTLEAMAQGMAIVAATDGALDMLADTQTALLTEGADTEGWLRHLRRLLQDPPAARRLGDAARRRVQAGHLCAHQVEALTRTIQGILSGGAYRLGEVTPA